MGLIKLNGMDRRQTGHESGKGTGREEGGLVGVGGR